MKVIISLSWVSIPGNFGTLNRLVKFIFGKNENFLDFSSIFVKKNRKIFFQNFFFAAYLILLEVFFWVFWAKDRKNWMHFRKVTAIFLLCACVICANEKNFWNPIQKKIIILLPTILSRKNWIIFNEGLLMTLIPGQTLIWPTVHGERNNKSHNL